MRDRHALATRAVHGGTLRSRFSETSEAIFLTQGYVYESAEQAEARFIESAADEFTYSRYGNPTVRMFESRIAAMQGCEDAFATASGMAAVNAALFSSLKAGDHVVSARALFGSCLYIVENILPQFGVETTTIDGVSKDAWQAAITPRTKLVFLEAVSNPTLEVIDLPFVSSLARSNGAKVFVDNALVSPVFLPAPDLGADVTIYSSTKHIDGQGRCLGGVVLGSREFVRETLEPYLKHTGGAMSPFNAWVMLKGLETISLRCNAQADTALALAECLQDHPKLNRTIYPLLAGHPQHELATQLMTKGGTVLSIDIAGGRDSAFRFLNALRIVKISNNFGDAKSLVTHPATTTHQRLSSGQRRELGISEGLVRISAGLEDADDLLNDIVHALDQV
ncbi:MAG: O-succinylhomoserine sulfhydrylase [Rhodobacteraceae bacterium]|nr:O-succinylhomoserine sulfhydrylase [Paracoccaceae bacterium]